MNVCCDLQEELKNDARFLTKAVTGDESWCYGYDPESKQQSTSGSRQIHPGGEKKMASLLKCQEIFFFDRIVHREFVFPGQTENQQFYECVKMTA